MFNSLLSPAADADDSDGDQEERSGGDQEERSSNSTTIRAREVWFHYFITIVDNNDGRR